MKLKFQCWSCKRGNLHLLDVFATKPPPLGHDVVVDPELAETMELYGFIECSSCGALVVYDDFVAAEAWLDICH
jgi:hypothetical protein